MARDLSPYSARRLLTQQLVQGKTASPPAVSGGNRSPSSFSKHGSERVGKEPSIASGRPSRSRSRERKPRHLSKDDEPKEAATEPSAVRKREQSPEPYRKPRDSSRERRRDGSRERRKDRSKDRRRDRSRDKRRDKSGDRKKDRSKDRRRDRSHDKDRGGDRHRKRDRSKDRHSRRDRSRSRDRRRKDRSKEGRRSRSPIPYRSRKPRTRSPSASTSPPPKRRRRTRSPSPSRSSSPHKRVKKALPSQEISFRGLDDSAQPPSKYGGAPPDKEKPNFKPTGALAKAANRVEGTKISLKYHEPPEARKPPASQPWRIFVFKGDDVVDTIEIWQKSCWLLGRSHEVVDYVLEHPSSSGQHAAIQFRYIQKTIEDEFGVKSQRGKVKPYIIDLESSNGTELNGEDLEASRYFELRDKDIIKFGTRGCRIAKMSLSRQSLSPTANLLRNSRLFSLPNPLPRPPVSETYGAGISKASDTATLPYPTHQAIATTKSSLARGDWGLKRPIPSRSHIVQTSDPVLRITQLDTIEHVTDFDSAADHVRTRQKWEEMGMPMMKSTSKITNEPPLGAFEVRDDTTSYDTEMGLDEAGLYLQALKKSMPAQRAKAQREAFNATWREKWQSKLASFKARGWADNLVEFEAFRKEASRGGSETKPWLEEFNAFQNERKEAKKALKEQMAAAPFTPFRPPPVDPVVHNTRRWKHDGPWLPGMSAEEFVSYLNKQITGRKKEFNEYLVEYVKNEIYATRRLAATKSGEVPPIDAQEAEAWHEQRENAWRQITQPQIEAGIRALRREAAKDPLSSKLVSKLIVPFLRIPTMKFKNTTFKEDASKRDIEMFQFDQETAPLSTHPSAGLGYLRHYSYIANHPILGPQAKPTPIPARLMQARRTGTSNELYARFGVGGFVANDQFKGIDYSPVNRNASMANAKDVETIDVDTPGGKKIMVQPRYASVTNDGRIHIKLDRATGPEVMIARGELDDKPPVRANIDNGDLESIVSGVGKSGVKELDEMSEKGQQLSEFLQREAPQGRAKPAKGFPGMAEALR